MTYNEFGTHLTRVDGRDEYHVSGMAVQQLQRVFTERDALVDKNLSLIAALTDIRVKVFDVVTEIERVRFNFAK